MSQSGTNYLQVQLFVDLATLEQVHTQIQQTNKRIELAGDLAEHDPVFVLELLRAANLMAVSEGKAPLTNTRTALVRLGLEGANELIGGVKGKDRIENPALLKHFEKVRKNCARIGGLAGTIAEVLAPNLKEDAIAIGSLLNIGELVAIAHLKDKYLEAAEGNARAKLLYRLEKDHNFDTEKAGVNYLKHCGLPEPIISIIDRDAKPQMPARQILKPVTATAIELYYATLDDKLDKFKPGETLPLKSTLRMMQLKEPQHKAIFEKVCDYVVKEKVL